VNQERHTNNRPVTRGRKRNLEEANGAEIEHVEARGLSRLESEEGESMDSRFLQDNADICVVCDSIPFWVRIRPVTTAKPNLGMQSNTLALWGGRF
jgi:hypothetical protein